VSRIALGQQKFKGVFDVLNSPTVAPAQLQRRRQLPFLAQSCDRPAIHAEQRKRADYFNVKELPNPEWVWADCFHGKQFATSFVCVTVTHGAPFPQQHPQLMLRHTSLHTPIQRLTPC
jgi:hypothetical protein